MSDEKWRVVKIFGPTLQGEGAMAGTVSHFVRFAGCDFRCSWCDTMEAVDPKQYLAEGASALMTAPEILKQIEALPHSQWVTLSGGNPLLYHNLGNLVALLHHAGYKVAVETQGSIYQPWAAIVDQLTISPKAPSSGMPMLVKHFTALTELISDRGRKNPATIKIVISDEEDFEWAVQLSDKLAFAQAQTPIYVQPCDTHPMTEKSVDVPSFTALRHRYEALVRMVLAHPKRSRFIVLPQLHKFVGVE